MKSTTFYEVCTIFDTLESMSSRNDMTITLSSFFKNLNQKDAQILSYLIQGRVAPLFVNAEFSYSEKSFVSLLTNISKVNNLDENISQKRKEFGDIGDTLEYVTNKLGYKTSDISLESLYDSLWEIVNTSGTGSVDSKNRIITGLMQKMSPLEAKYLSRIVCGSLRFGLNVKTLLDVFSFVVQGDKGLREELDRAYGAYADIGYICSLIVGNGKGEVVKNLSKVNVNPGIPVLPRLVERVPSFEEVPERLGESFLVQSKYDGLRCQIHKFKTEKTHMGDSVWTGHIKSDENGQLFSVAENDCQVRLFTRNLEDITDMFPEIVESAKSMKEESFILDSEVLGWDNKRSKFLTFQETMQRRRKYDIKNVSGSIPVKAMAFDILYLNGEGLLNKDTEQRITILGTLNTYGGIEVDDTKRIGNIDELKEIFNERISRGHEGVIVKGLKGPYLPGVRNYEWIKLKKSMEGKLVDSIDLVAVGYTLGSGRRKDLGVGAVLGALYNEANDTFEAICNVGTGFSDEQLKDIFKSLEGDILKNKPKNVSVDKILKPDVWVEPRVVFTVEADEITRKKGAKTLSLRFPRLIEWGRDKGVTEATSVKELEDMFEGRK
jgi:DNA ligase-1